MHCFNECIQAAIQGKTDVIVDAILDGRLAFPNGTKQLVSAAVLHSREDTVRALLTLGSDGVMMALANACEACSTLGMFQAVVDAVGCQVLVMPFQDGSTALHRLAHNDRRGAKLQYACYVAKDFASIQDSLPRLSSHCWQVGRPGDTPLDIADKTGNVAMQRTFRWFARARWLQGCTVASRANRV